MADEKDTLAALGRFSEPALFILISLAGGAKHGYAIMEDVAQITGTRLGAGTLYGAIARLEQHVLIEPLPSADRRRPYQLTERGMRVLQHHLNTFQRLTAIGLERLGGAS